MLGYEWRPFESRRTGFFAKAGPQLSISLDENAQVASGRVALGVQHRFTESFSMVLQPSAIIARGGVGTGVKLGFSWAF